MTRHYELLYLVSGNHTEEALPGIKDGIRVLLEKFQATVSFEDNLGKKKLAYPVKNSRHGYYLLFEFEMDSENLKELDRAIALTPEVMRHQVVKRDPKAPRITNITPITTERVAPDKPEQPRSEYRSKTAPAAAAAAPASVDPINMEQLDEKLDEIIKGDIL